MVARGSRRKQQPSRSRFRAHSPSTETFPITLQAVHVRRSPIPHESTTGRHRHSVRKTSYVLVRAYACARSRMCACLRMLQNNDSPTGCEKGRASHSPDSLQSRARFGPSEKRHAKLDPQRQEITSGFLESVLRRWLNGMPATVKSFDHETGRYPHPCVTSHALCLAGQ